MSESMGFDATRPASRRGFKLLLVGVVLAVSGTLALSAWAQSGYGGHGMGGPGMGGPGMMMGGPERMTRRIDHMLDGLGASDAQRSQIKQIAQAAAADLKAQHEASRGLRLRGLELFAAPTVDAAAAEALRQQMLAQHDQASKRTLQAMLEVSRVLTPEQRVKLGERWKRRGEQMRERHQRWEREQPRR